MKNHEKLVPKRSEGARNIHTRMPIACNSFMEVHKPIENEFQCFLTLLTCGNGLFRKNPPFCYVCAQKQYGEVNALNTINHMHYNLQNCSDARVGYFYVTCET